MIPGFDSITFWLGETYILGTVLLVAASAALSFIRQPARRMPVAWGAMAGLFALAILPALSWWPRIRMPIPQSAIWQSDAPAQAQSPHGPLAAAAPVESEVIRLDEPAANLADVAILPYTEVAPANLEDSPSRDVESVGMNSITEAGPTSLDEPRGFELTSRDTQSVTWNPDVAVALAERPDDSPDWKARVTGLWFSGALLATIWIAGGAWRTRRLFRRSQDAPGWIRDELRRVVPSHRREPATRISRFVASALAYGAIRPAILIRDSQAEPDERRGIRAALAHEYAHIAHGDLWLLACERLLLPVYFAHPLFWLLRRWIRRNQELLADAAAAGEAPVDYAEALLEWAKSSPATHASAFSAALPLWSSPCHLKRRIEMLLDVRNPISRHASRFWRWTVLSTMLSLVTALSLVTFQAAHSGQDGAERPSAAQTLAAQITSQLGPIPIAVPETPPRSYIVEVDVVLVRVDDGKLAAHESSLAKLVNAACDPAKSSKSKDGVVAGHLPSELAKKLLEDIMSQNAGIILAEPKISAGFETNPTYSDPASGAAAIAAGAEDIRFKHAGGALRIHTEPIDLGRSKPVRLKLRVAAEYTPQPNTDNSGQRELEVESSSARKVSYSAQIQLGEAVIIADGCKNVPTDKTSRANLIIVTPRAVTPIFESNSNTGSSPELESLRKVVEELKQEIRSLRNQPQTPSSQGADKAAQPRATDAGRNLDQELLRLDVEEAELNVSTAKAAYETAQKAKEANSVADRLAALRKAEIALARAKLRAQLGERAQTSAAATDASGDVADKARSLTQKMRELDAQEAQNDFDTAKEAYDFKVRLHKKGYLGDSELAVAKLAFQKAELAKKRADLRLKSFQPPTVERKDGSSKLDSQVEQIRKYKRSIESLESQLQDAKQAVNPTGWTEGIQFSAPLGLRQAQAHVRESELRLAKAKEALAAMEREFSKLGRMYGKDTDGTIKNETTRPALPTGSKKEPEVDGGGDVKPRPVPQAQLDQQFTAPGSH